MTQPNPFRIVYDAAIERGESVHRAICCAKDFYADHVRNLVNNDCGDEYALDRLREYTRLLDEAVTNSL